MITKLAQFTDIRVALVVGGLSVQVQAATLRTSPEVVVATPVRAAVAICHVGTSWVAQCCTVAMFCNMSGWCCAGFTYLPGSVSWLV